jgi:hypothetical protein
MTSIAFTSLFLGLVLDPAGAGSGGAREAGPVSRGQPALGTELPAGAV